MKMTSQPPTVYRADYQQPPFWIDAVELEFDLDESQTKVHAKINFVRNETVDRSPLVLNGEELHLLNVRLDGRELSPEAFQVNDQFLTIENAPDRFLLETTVEINPDDNKTLSGLYRSSGNFCTQCEAMGFRRITYFLDRPDVMCTYRVTIRAEKKSYPVLLSNGNRIESKDLADGRHQVTWEDPFAKPSYLFALVGGKLKCHRGAFQTASGKDVQLEIWVEPQNIDKCEHALQSLIKSMKWDEDIFGLEYDLGIYMIVAVNDFNMGAMENKGLNIFNTKYVLASAATATDTDFELVEAVIAHEYFHNWTGNRVTCRDWFQLTLKEGLTVFRDQQFTADMTSAAVKRIDDVNSLRTRQLPEDAGPMAHPIRPESYISMDNFYTATVYDKGAEIIRMYHTLLGAEGFRQGMDLYFQRHDGTAVTCDDFRSAMADANHCDLDQFGRWYSQAGTPFVEVTTDWIPESNQFTMHFRQGYPEHAYDVPGTKDRKPLHLPILVGLIGPDGEELNATSGDAKRTKAGHLIELKTEQASVTFGGVSREPIPSVLRNFTAPVKLKMNRSRRELAFLMSHDRDPFCRWDASQQLATQLILELIDHYQNDQPMHVDPVFVEAFGDLLVDDTLDGSYKSLLMTLPSEIVLGQEMTTVDPNAIHAVRCYVLGHLAGIYRRQLLHLYRTNRKDEPYRNDKLSIQRRRIKNTALNYLTWLKDKELITLARDQFRSTNNMTDRQAALAALCEQDVPARSEVLAAFYNQWKNEPLVVDKWFAIQAGSGLESTLDEVIRLSHHKDFTLENPNRIRSLVGVFGALNQLHFHHAEGRGYEFVADHIIKLNAINPQTAARLVSPFNQWKRFDENRQNLMRNQLMRIQQTDGLSKDVGEIVSRALGS